MIILLFNKIIYVVFIWISIWKYIILRSGANFINRKSCEGWIRIRKIEREYLREVGQEMKLFRKRVQTIGKREKTVQEEEEELGCKFCNFSR